MNRAMVLWTFAQAMRDLQRQRIWWAIIGLIPPDGSMRAYWDSRTEPEPAGQ